MSGLKYANGTDPGQAFSDAFGYSQIVTIPANASIIRLSGQGGWEPTGAVDAKDTKKQVDLTIENIDKMLQSQGLKGWEDVFFWRLYATNIDECLPLVVAKLKERIPNHRPSMTALSVSKLALPEMVIEIEVEAYKAETAKL